MANDPDQRTYDTLRLLDTHEPIGSIRLTERLRERGYSITERAVRLTLADLDEAGFTEKVGGKGRCLTDKGRAELRHGGVRGRIEQVRERLAELMSQVTYNPENNNGTVVVGTVTIPKDARAQVESEVRAIDRSPFGPAPVSIDPVDRNGKSLLKVTAASSVTIDGVLLRNGIETKLDTTGIVEYHPDPDTVPYDGHGVTNDNGAILRFTDVIGEERATVDMVSLLIEARRTSVGNVLKGRAGLLVADNREIPLSQYESAASLTSATRDELGGVHDLRRPREPGPFPWGQPGWSFASLTCVGAAELIISRFVESEIAVSWSTLDGIQPRESLSTVD